MNTATAQRIAPDARNTYLARSTDIARLLDVLQMELETHAQGAAAQPRSWAKVGDLEKVRSDMINLVSFMSGLEPAEVEEFLTH